MRAKVRADAGWWNFLFEADADVFGHFENSAEAKF
jgi:hypothetical protein